MVVTVCETAVVVGDVPAVRCEMMLLIQNEPLVECGAAVAACWRAKDSRQQPGAATLTEIRCCCH